MNATEVDTGDNERESAAAADRSLFVQELLLSSLCEGLRLSDDEDLDPSVTLENSPSAALSSPLPSAASSYASANATLSASQLPPVNNVVLVESNSLPSNYGNSTTVVSVPQCNNSAVGGGNKPRKPPPPSSSSSSSSSTSSLSSSPSSHLVKH